MPHPTLTTTWPTGNDLRRWLGPQAVSMVTDVDLVDDMVADAAAKLYEQIDPGKLPENPDECPRSLHRAIVIEAARLLFRTQSPHGIAAFGEIAVRLRTADVDVETLLAPYRLDSDP